MKDPQAQLPDSRTWREIPQPVRPRAMSREGRKRFVRSGLKTAGVILAVGIMAWGLIAVVNSWQNEPKRIARAVGTLPVDKIELKTNGVLDQAWAERTLALSHNVTLMELDLPALQQRLLASGQVRSVVLTKVFPSTLRVEAVERPPVARLRAESGRDFLVARDGVVFAGIGHDAAMVESLPWLAGVTLVPVGHGFVPIDGMETVSDLLATALNQAPGLYRTWNVVNLARLESDGEIEVRSSEIEKIVFSTSMDFFSQIARLDYVRDTAREAPLRSVNLGLGAQVVVDFEAVTLGTKSAAASPGRRTSSPQLVLPALPKLQNRTRTNRDL